MDIDDTAEIEDLSPATLAAMAERLRHSVSAEHCVYRETELDQLWRLADVAIGAGVGSPFWSSLPTLRTAIVEAHDLAGIELKPREAATRLERLLKPGG